MFCERLKEIRKKNGLTQEDMARMLNISATAYGDYERGRTEPNLLTLKKIANILNVSIDYLLENKQEKSKDEIIDELISLAISLKDK